MQPDHDREPKSGSDLSSDAGNPPPTSPGKSEPNSGRSRWLSAWVIPAALLSGLLTWIVGESTLNFFCPHRRGDENRSLLHHHDRQRTLPPGEAPVAIQNSALHYGILGVTLGMGLGLPGG